MADENTEEVVEAKKGNPMMMVLIILVVLLIGAVGFLGYMMMNNMNADDQGKPKAEQEEMMKKDEAKDEGEYFKAKIENLVLNITNSKGREKLMKLSFSVKSVEPSIGMLVENSKDEIIDTVIQQIASRSSEELLTVGGKELLREELLDEINIIINSETSKNEEVLRNNVKNLYFTTFVIK